MTRPDKMDLKTIIREAVHKLIEENIDPRKVKKSLDVHEAKVHFIPARYRIIGGVIQALNIQFGNFIEILLGQIVEHDPKVSEHPLSRKRLALSMTAETDALIDSYITGRQLPDSADQCDVEFRTVCEEILRNEQNESLQKRKITKDVDLIFSVDGRYVYAEVKYNDDHDTGKFVDINRKFLKTFAGLINELGVTKVGQLTPILYYFNPVKRWGPIYTPVSNIMRGAQLFERYFETRYADVDRCLRDAGEDPKVLDMFDRFYKYVRYEMK